MNKFYLSILAIVWLTGCASHIHQVVREGNAPFIDGELIHDQGESNRLVLEVSNRRYEAHGFAVERQSNLAALRKRYYVSNRKHWEQIFAGLDTDHVVYSINTVAISPDGSKISCHLTWVSRANPSGVCTDQGGAVLPVQFNGMRG
ncbi:MAG: hypothetical protein HY938_06750 [Nitrosomonadales bacterium]|nr:hypothetical protein [Nitrosomonadales bacterium]